MTVVQTIEAAHIPAAQLDALESFAQHLDKSELRDVLLSLTQHVRGGADLALVEEQTDLTPSQAAKRLGMSRTHLYKLLDRGEIVSNRVGRDRRIHIEDLARFEAARQRDRRELAERFAHQDQTRRGAVEELLDEL